VHRARAVHRPGRQVREEAVARFIRLFRAHVSMATMN
jgi:hypothetical protein